MAGGLVQNDEMQGRSVGVTADRVFRRPDNRRRTTWFAASSRITRGCDAAYAPSVTQDSCDSL